MKTPAAGSVSKTSTRTRNAQNASKIKETASQGAERKASQDSTSHGSSKMKSGTQVSNATTKLGKVNLVHFNLWLGLYNTPLEEERRQSSQ